MAFALKNAVPHIDTLFKEYLLFRGFTKTLLSLEAEIKADKLKGFKVSLLVDEILACVDSFDLENLRGLWQYLDQRFFSQLDPSFAPTVLKLEHSLYKYYLVRCKASHHNDKVKHFFEAYSEDLWTNEEWRDWFALPYLKNPEYDSKFAVFFTKSWASAFAQSLHNFLATIFQSIPLPKVLNFNVARLEEQKRELQIEYLTSEVERLKLQLETAHAKSAEYKKTLTSYGIAPREESNASKQKVFSTEAIVRAQRKLEAEETRVRASKEQRNRESRAATPSSLLGGEAIRSDVYADRKTREVMVPEETPGGPSSLKNNRVVSQEVISGHTSPITRCRFSPSGDFIASASLNGTVRIWSTEAVSSRSVASGKGLMPISTDSATSPSSTRGATIFIFNAITALEWEGKRDALLCCGTSDGRIKLWNSSSNEVVGDAKTMEGFPRVCDLSCQYSSPHVAGAVTSADGRRGYLGVWDIGTAASVATFRLDVANPQFCARYNRNGKLLASGGADGVVRVYDVNTSLPVMTWRADASKVLSVRFSRDEDSLYVLGSSGLVSEWSLHTSGKKAVEYLWGDVGPSDFAFDWEGQHFIAGGGSRSNDAFIFKTGSENCVRRLTGHTKPVVSVDWHPSDNMCLTGSLDSTVRLITLS